MKKSKLTFLMSEISRGILAVSRRCLGGIEGVFCGDGVVDVELEIPLWVVSQPPSVVGDKEGLADKLFCAEAQSCGLTRGQGKVSRW